MDIFQNNLILAALAYFFGFIGFKAVNAKKPNYFFGLSSFVVVMMMAFIFAKSYTPKVMSVETEEYIFEKLSQEK